MQCQNCHKKTATIHLTEIVNGQRSEIHLCETCAQKQGLAVKAQMPLNELLETLLSAQSETEEETETTADTACPYCGMTIKNFLKTSLLGCANDYEVWEKALRPVLERSHAGRTTHCGKIPSRASVGVKKQARLLELRKKLDAAVRSEDYETAAGLRDDINRLQQTPDSD